MAEHLSQNCKPNLTFFVEFDRYRYTDTYTNTNTYLPISFKPIPILILGFPFYFLPIPIPILVCFFHLLSILTYIEPIITLLHFQPILKPIPISNLLFISNRYRYQLLSHLTDTNTDTGIGIGITDVNRYRSNSNFLDHPILICPVTFAYCTSFEYFMSISCWTFSLDMGLLLP
jgi:hypothetical protein